MVRAKLSVKDDTRADGADPRQGWGVSPARMERLKTHARAMRRNPTEPEIALWEQLQSQKLGGFKFQRHMVVGSAIADFACPARWLVIEVDGDAHDTPAIDTMRDRKLTEVGIRVLRFAADEVLQDAERVGEVILIELQKPFDKRAAQHRPSFEETVE